MDVVLSIIMAIFKESVYLFNEMSPYLILGFLIAGILHVALPPNFMSRFMGKKNLASVIKAALLGVPLPLCSCGVIPTGVSLHKDGASKGAAVSFLISTPQTGVDSFFVTYSMLGLPFAVIRPLVALLTGVFGGALVDKFTKEQNISPAVSKSARTQKNKTEPERKKNIFTLLYEIFHYAFVDLLIDISKWLVVGILVAAVLAAFVPDNFFATQLKNPLLSMAVMLLFSIPFYVCSTGSVPIAAVLLLKGISPGAAFAFLMAGPATNVATITVIARSMGKKVLFLYLAAIMMGAVLFGLLMDYALPAHWFMVSGSAHLGHSHGLLPLWLTYISSVVLFVFMLYGLARPLLLKMLARFSKPQSATMRNDKTQTSFKVKGMDCNHCKASVENGLKTIEGIETIEADIVQGRVSFCGNNVDLKKVKKIMDDLGFGSEGLP